MSTSNDEHVEAAVAFISGALIGVAITLLFFRIQRRRVVRSRINYDEYNYDGGDLFV